MANSAIRTAAAALVAAACSVLAASAAAPAAALAKAVDALKEDFFDTPEEKAAALKVVQEAFAAPTKENEAGRIRFLNEIAAGIQQGFKGGWDNFELAPQPQKWLGAVNAEKETPKGTIMSAWKYEGAKCIWRFTIPEGTKATVCVNGMCKPHKAGEYTLEIKE